MYATIRMLANLNELTPELKRAMPNAPPWFYRAAIGFAVTIFAALDVLCYVLTWHLPYHWLLGTACSVAYFQLIPSNEASDPRGWTGGTTTKFDRELLKSELVKLREGITPWIDTPDLFTVARAYPIPGFGLFVNKDGTGGVLYYDDGYAHFACPERYPGIAAPLATKAHVLTFTINAFFPFEL